MCIKWNAVPISVCVGVEATQSVARICQVLRGELFLCCNICVVYIHCIMAGNKAAVISNLAATSTPSTGECFRGINVFH